MTRILATLIAAGTLLSGCTIIAGRGNRGAGIGTAHGSGEAEREPAAVATPAPLPRRAGEFPAGVTVGGVAIDAPIPLDDVLALVAARFVKQIAPKTAPAPTLEPTPTPTPTKPTKPESASRGLPAPVMLNVTGDAWHTFSDCPYLRAGFYSVRADRIPPGRTHLCITCSRRTGGTE